MCRKKINSPLFAVLLVLGAVWTMALYNIPTLGNILCLKYARPISTSFMRFKSFSYPRDRVRHKWVGYDEMSDYLKDAVVIAEDDGFFRHAGLDWKAIRLAAKKNWKRKRLDFGASTITQQLAKNLYLHPTKIP